MNTNTLFEYLEDLLIYAYHLTRDKDHAEDLVQDIVVQFLDKETCLSGVEHPRRYMTIAMRNLFLDQMRKDQRGPFLETIDDHDLTDLNGDGFSQIACAQTLAAIGRLPEEYRTVMRLRVNGGFSYAEMARQLKIPVGTVMSRMSRAREKLRELL